MQCPHLREALQMPADRRRSLALLLRGFMRAGPGVAVPAGSCFGLLAAPAESWSRQHSRVLATP